MNANGKLQADEGAKTSVALVPLSNSGYNGKCSTVGKSGPAKPHFVRIIPINRI